MIELSELTPSEKEGAHKKPDSRLIGPTAKSFGEAVWPGTRCPLEADAPTALDYPTDSICPACPTVTRNFAQPHMSRSRGHKEP